MPVIDKQVGLKVMREFYRRQSLDVSDLRVSASGGTVYLNGRLKLSRTAVGVSIEEEVVIVGRNIRQIPGVRDVVVELEGMRDIRV